MGSQNIPERSEQTEPFERRAQRTGTHCWGGLGAQAGGDDTLSGLTVQHQPTLGIRRHFAGDGTEEPGSMFAGHRAAVAGEAWTVWDSESAEGFGVVWTRSTKLTRQHP